MTWRWEADRVTVGGRSDRFPLGAALTREVLAADFHPTLARLRASEPVTWVPASNGWLVTRRDLASAVLRDSETFTVDDPRFSTGRVLGPSMLSLDGSEHERHRAPFASALCLPRVSEELVPSVARIARDLVEEMASDTRAELRTDLAGPLAVGVVSLTLDLMGVDPVEMRAWYDEIVAAVSAASDDPGGEVPAPPAVDRLGRHIRTRWPAGRLSSRPRRSRCRRPRWCRMPRSCSHPCGNWGKRPRYAAGSGWPTARIQCHPADQSSVK